MPNGRHPSRLWSSLRGWLRFLQIRPDGNSPPLCRNCIRGRRHYPAVERLEALEVPNLLSSPFGPAFGTAAGALVDSGSTASTLSSSALSLEDADASLSAAWTTGSPERSSDI